MLNRLYRKFIQTVPTHLQELEFAIKQQGEKAVAEEEEEDEDEDEDMQFGMCGYPHAQLFLSESGKYLRCERYS